MLNTSLHYLNDLLLCDQVPVSDIAAACGTPVYIYSLRRVLDNLQGIRSSFAALNPHIHYSVKANANQTILRALVRAGAGMDAVSGGEIFRALRAGARPETIVFAGVGKTPAELRYALEQGVGWFNVENVEECRWLNDLAGQLGRSAVRVALRLNPQVAASTHRHIATGHGGAKFGLTTEAARFLLDSQADYPHLRFEGIHVHIGSQLHEVQATAAAVRAACELAAPYPGIRTINMGGGLPVGYHPSETLPDAAAFAAAVAPWLAGYQVLLEPGRSVVADAGLLVVTVLYVKRQAGQVFVVTDGSMAELLRPALYDAHHELVPVRRPAAASPLEAVQVVGPVCESADVLARDCRLPPVQPGDSLAVLTAGAYGMVMASNYNQRPRPPEVVVTADGTSWSVTRRRETWDDLVRLEVED